MIAGWRVASHGLWTGAKVPAGSKSRASMTSTTPVPHGSGRCVCGDSDAIFTAKIVDSSHEQTWFTPRPAPPVAAHVCAPRPRATARSARPYRLSRHILATYTRGHDTHTNHQSERDTSRERWRKTIASRRPSGVQAGAREEPWAPPSLCRTSRFRRRAMRPPPRWWARRRHAARRARRGGRRRARARASDRAGATPCSSASRGRSPSARRARAGA